MSSFLYFCSQKCKFEGVQTCVDFFLILRFVLSEWDNGISLLPCFEFFFQFCPIFSDLKNRKIFSPHHFFGRNIFKTPSWNFWANTSFHIQIPNVIVHWKWSRDNSWAHWTCVENRSDPIDDWQAAQTWCHWKRDKNKRAINYKDILLKKIKFG